MKECLKNYFEPLLNTFPAEKLLDNTNLKNIEKFREKAAKDPKLIESVLSHMKVFTWDLIENQNAQELESLLKRLDENEVISSADDCLWKYLKKLMDNFDEKDFDAYTIRAFLESMEHPTKFQRTRPPNFVRLQNYFLARLHHSRQANMCYLLENATRIKVFNMILAFVDNEISESKKMKIINPAFDCAIQANDEHLMQILHKRLEAINCKFSSLEYCCRNSGILSQSKHFLQEYKFDDHKPYQFARAARAIRYHRPFGVIQNQALAMLFSKLNSNLTSRFVKQQKKQLLNFYSWSFEAKQSWFPGLNFDLLESMNPFYPLTMKMLLLWCKDEINYISFVNELNDWHNFSPFQADDIYYALENCFTLLDGDKLSPAPPEKNGFAQACYYLTLLLEPRIDVHGNSLVFHVFSAKSNKKTFEMELAKNYRKYSPQKCMGYILEAIDLLNVLLQREDCERKSEILKYLANYLSD